MTQIALPYVHAFKTRHGKLVSYYRRHGRRQRLHGAVGSPEWLANYQRIHAQHEGRPDKPVGDKTWRALVAKYRAAPEYTKLSERTKADYERHIARIVDAMGDNHVASLTRADIFDIRDKLAADIGIRQAEYCITVMNRLLKLGVDRGFRKDHPGQRIEKVYEADGHRPWMDAEIAAFRAHWTLGTWERTAFELLLNTGQRRGDIGRMTWPQIAGGWIRVKQRKTGDLLEIPVSRQLDDALRAWPRTGVVVLIGDKGKAVGYDRFGHRLTDAFEAAGLVGVTIHGLRYTTATLLRELGVPIEARQAVLGHRTVAMAEKYSAQRREAGEAVRRMEEG